MPYYIEVPRFSGDQARSEFNGMVMYQLNVARVLPHSETLIQLHT